ncbi:S8 family peptidase [Bacillus sp. AFS037270]|uniref:S8 family peptidase n=1 Tax=Bacillus sp. AFS037270 TaxID=2033499 RepID=UPI000BFBA10B|nr:S8 family peptidase [Bacillus sp. AFS037270]PGV53557.1 serine protease [Bacillus sp. AFS037270]
MFGYTMVQMVRSYAHKLDHSLRESILNLYKPFKWTPCFLHNFFEGSIKKRKKLSVIIEFEEGCFEDGCQVLNEILGRHKKNRLRHHFHRISCSSADLTPNGLEEILVNCSHIKKVYLNSEVKAFLNVAVPSVNAKGIVRNGKELTGSGVKIAIVDTGIYPHPDLSGRITDFVDFINNRTAPYDDNGHGTHCAGDAASASLRYTGPAPKANLVGVKVLDRSGSGSLETIMRGVEWCIQYNEQNPTNKIDIISMSLGSTPRTYRLENQDPMVKIVESAWQSGIVVCVAAGNEGPDRGTIASPGISDRVITVGAFDDKDTLQRTDDDVASFSSRGPTIYNVKKPDILAPGVDIVSLRSPNSYLDRAQKSSRVGSNYFTLSGTSMATPICAGIVALIKESNPQLNPDEIKNSLTSGTVLWKDKDYNVYGAGYIDANNSIP